MRPTRRQMAFWTGVALVELLLVAAGVHHLLSLRTPHTVVIGPAPDIDASPQSCASLPTTLAAEELAAQDPSCDLVGTIVVVRGDQLPTLPGVHAPRDMTITLPSRGGFAVQVGRDGAGGIGIIELGRDLGAVVYTEDKAAVWTQPPSSSLILRSGNRRLKFSRLNINREVHAVVVSGPHPSEECRSILSELCRPGS